MKENTSNPILSNKAFNVVGTTQLDGVMSVNGVINKTFILLLLTIGAALLSWQMLPASFAENANLYLFGSAIVGFILALIISFKPLLAPFLSPVYAVVEGIFIGGISMLFETYYPGIAMQAAFGTFSVFFVMLILYRTRVIKVTQKFRSIVVGATVGIMFLYLASILGNMIFNYQIPLIHDSGILGIGISIFIIIVAALNLALDFDFIEKQVERGANKNIEWYAAFGLIVTLIWLYLEMLRLLSKLRD